MEYLAVTIIGTNDTQIADKLTGIAAQCKSNIIECRMSTLGEEFVANILYAGTWDAIAKVENNLELLTKKDNRHHIQLLKRRTKEATLHTESLPYLVYVVAKDQEGILFLVSHFFAERGIPISEFYSETRPARRSDCEMISINMSVDIPTNVNVAELRESFMIFCDSYNLDGMLEADKGL